MLYIWEKRIQCLDMKCEGEVRKLWLNLLCWEIGTWVMVVPLTKVRNTRGNSTPGGEDKEVQLYLIRLSYLEIQVEVSQADS